MTTGPAITPPLAEAASPDQSGDWQTDVWTGLVADYAALTQHLSVESSHTGTVTGIAALAEANDPPFAGQPPRRVSLGQGLAWAYVQPALDEIAAWEPSLTDPDTGQIADSYILLGAPTVVSIAAEVTYDFDLPGVGTPHMDGLLRQVDPAMWDHFGSHDDIIIWTGNTPPGFAAVSGGTLLKSIPWATGGTDSLPIDASVFTDGILAVTLSSSDLETGTPPRDFTGVWGWELNLRSLIVRYTYQPPDYRLVFASARTPLRARQRASGVTGAIPLRGRNNAPEGLRGRQDANA